MPLLLRYRLAGGTLKFSIKDHLLNTLQVGELRDNLNLDGFKFQPSNKGLVIWRWKWTDKDDMFEYTDSSDDEEITVIPETPPAVSDEEEQVKEEEKEEDCDGFHLGFSPIVTHTVTFKCMGTTKEDRYQETLACVAQLTSAGHEVRCKLQAEPENPFDSRAIAFRCEVDSSWHTTGYVVKEALDDVHEALLAKKLLLYQLTGSSSLFTGEPLAGMQELKYQGLESGLGQLYFHKVLNNRKQQLDLFNANVNC